MVRLTLFPFQVTESTHSMGASVSPAGLPGERIVRRIFKNTKLFSKTKAGGLTEPYGPRALAPGWTR